MPNFRNEARWDHLVVAYESSSHSEAALDFAIELAERLGARLHVVHVTDMDDYPVDPDMAGSDVEAKYIEESLSAERTAVESRMSDFSGDWEYINESGDTVRRISELADHLDAVMVVVGGPIHGLLEALHRTLTGSVGRVLAERSARAVTVVPPYPSSK
ncbi:universal stress protein [Streptomyces sp. NPDC047046]|uniref:universal stress protein n=1 Tax=Streptomyces sp. NPDC047046 TaxID=3155378 RepID=UPI0033D1EFC7